MGVLGAGRIGSAMIRALKSCRSDLEVYASGRSEETLAKALRLGAEVSRDNAYVVRKSDLVIVSVKPHNFLDLYNQVPVDFWSGKLVVSVMAGVKLETLSRVLRGAKVFRAMPNINTLVSKSATAIATNDNNSDDRSTVENVLRCFGSVYWVPEEYLDIWTSLVGSGPAFIAEIIDGLVLGAVSSGMTRDVAYRAILDMIEGTVKLLRELDSHPIEVRDEVTTPSGTTIQGLKVLEAKGIKAGLIEVIETSFRRSREIGVEIDSSIKSKINW
ncbi:MAG: pyrroline-5-carboxylate reductase [Zestosphaera sp.]